MTLRLSFFAILHHVAGELLLEEELYVKSTDFTFPLVYSVRIADHPLRLV